jgi:DNA-binding GntR family transcriptional regulator
MMDAAILTGSIGKGAGNLADQAYASIKQQIFSFQLMPGQLLSENILSKTVEVSRTPLRQALQRLQYEGYVTPIPKVGWQVAPVDFAKIDELYDFRLLIETHCVQILCASREHIPFVEHMLIAWDINVQAMPLVGADVGSLDEAFHHALVHAVGNAEIVRTHTDITERIRLVRRLDFTQQHRIQDTYAEHTAILKSILSQNNLQTRSLLRAHIERSKAKVREITLSMLHHARVTA